MADALIGSIAETDSALLLTDSGGAKVRLTATSGSLVVSIDGTDVLTVDEGLNTVVDTLNFSTATTGVNEIIVPDNLADALSIKIASGNDLIKLVSTDNAEGVTITPPITLGGRLDFTGFNPVAADTDGALIKAGTSGAPITEDTPNIKFVSMYFDDGATSGEAVGIYDRLYVTGAGGEGIALRSFCSVTDVIAANARGAHISLSFGASGTITGLGAALEATLHIPTTAGATGTLYAVKAAINSDGAASDPAGATTLAYFAAVNQGDATGGADVDTDAVLLDISGHTIAGGNLVEPVTTGYALAELTHSLRIKIGSTLYYIPISNLAASAT